ncbi:MAG: hypothetical protein ACYDBJ_28420 [Aggregatilineales bacterium]
MKRLSCLLSGCLCLGIALSVLVVITLVFMAQHPPPTVPVLAPPASPTAMMQGLSTTPTDAETDSGGIVLVTAQNREQHAADLSLWDNHSRAVAVYRYPAGTGRRAVFQFTNRRGSAERDRHVGRSHGLVRGADPGRARPCCDSACARHARPLNESSPGITHPCPAAAIAVSDSLGLDCGQALGLVPQGQALEYVRRP